MVTAHPSFALESEHKDGHDCHFASALQDASLGNLSIPFNKLYRTIEPWSRSLPLLVHHKEKIIDACCAALTIQLADEDPKDDLDIDSQTSKLHQSAQAKKNSLVQADKERKRKSLKARERVDLAALTVLDLLAPLIVDLSTALLETSPHSTSTSPFEKLLTTLLYFINLPNPEPLALEKATQVIVHLFKTLAQDFTSPDDDSGLGTGRLHRIWQLTRVALGAPSVTYLSNQNPTHENVIEPTEMLEGEEAEGSDNGDGVDSESGSPAEAIEIKSPKIPAVDTLDDPETALPTTDELVDSTMPVQPVPVPDTVEQSDQNVLKGALNTTNPSTRRLLATSLAFLLRKKNCSNTLIQMMLSDLTTVESDEILREGCLRSRKEKDELDRKGVGKRNLLGEEKGGARVFAEGITWAMAESCKVSYISIVVCVFEDYACDRANILFRCCLL